MKFRSLLIGFVFLLLSSACSGEGAETELSPSLPAPEVKVVEVTQPAEQSPSEPDSVELTQNQYSGSRMAFGLESHAAQFEGHADLVGEPGMTLMRHNGLLWHEIEPVEGVRDWTVAGELEGILERASTSGLSTILIVRGTPEWAQRVPGSFCGPILPEKLGSFVDFMTEAVQRYSQPPYNIRYWELGNEPDVDPLLVGANSVFGCWGNHQDPFYGGGYYAEMLKVVYPAIKRVDPEAQVLIGGLLLDCDPNQPPEGKDCSAGTFLEGILRAGGGDYFDLVSFHGYTPYFGPDTGFPYPLSVDTDNPSWTHLGGVVVGKINFIRQVMEKYQVEKPLVHTEGALMCAEYNPTDCEQPGELFFENQADYAVRMYVRNWAHGIQGTIWYQFEGPGWRYGGLLDEEQNPKPVYDALVFLANALSESQYNGEITQLNGLQAYEFTSPQKRTWVVWSPEQVDTSFQLPVDTLTAFDKYGNSLAASDGSLVVNSPIYLEFEP